MPKRAAPLRPLRPPRRLKPLSRSIRRKYKRSYSDWLWIIPIVFLTWLVYRWLGAGSFLFVIQVILLTVSLYLVPTLSYQLAHQLGRVAYLVFETLIFLAVLFGFVFWILGTAAFGVWMAYAILVILLIETGSHFLEYHKDVTLARLANSLLSHHIKYDAEAFEKMFRNEEAVYISVPMGLGAGITVGLVRNQPSQAILITSLQIALLLASVIMLFFLIYAFIRMKDPLFRTAQMSSAIMTNEQIKVRKGLTAWMGRILRFLVPPPKREIIDQEQRDLNLAYMVTDLRKTYLYDAVHNVFLLMAFSVVLIGLRGITINVRWLIASLLGLLFLFNQLPFVLGQSSLHEKILERYEGTKRVDMSEKLKKYSPLFPTSDFWIALFATGTGGGMVYFLIDDFIKEVLK